MYFDARKLDGHQIIEGDICIIGAGAAGISMALDWIDSPYTVILLEGGGLEYDHEVQQLYKGNSTGQPYYPLVSSRLHYFGGTTGHWAGMCSPFDPIDFEQRDWVPNSGWPISLQDLHPYYAKANEVLHLGPYEYGLEYWSERLPDMTPFPLDEEVIWNKMWQYSTARFGTLYRQEIMEAPNIHLYTYANVVDIKANETVSAITEVTTSNPAGRTHTIKARHFVLACGAIQNARMLLASNSQAPGGLGNDHDVVGRYFMEHLELPSAEMWLFEPFSTNLYGWSYGETVASAELAITYEAQHKHQILNGTASFSPLSVARLVENRMKLWADEDPRKALEHLLTHWGQKYEEGMTMNTGAMEQAFEFMIRIEQAPNPDSRITLGPERDQLGVPQAQLHWQMTELDKRSIRTIFHLIGQQMGASGIGRLKLYEFLWDEEDNLTWPEKTNAGWHHMGTTRMGTDTSTSVVNQHCQVHGIGNLHVAGSACYVTSAAPNPTLTLVALSLRLSEHLKGRMQEELVS